MGERQEGRNTPLVYVARGSHANYFSAGSHWTGTWFDQADGKGPQISPTLEIVGDKTPAWLHWPGWWGDTKATSSPLDSTSPTSPGAAPTGSTRSSSPAPRPPSRAPAPPAPPKAVARREGDRIVVAYEADPQATALVVATAAHGLRPSPPPRTRSRSTQATGEVELPAHGDDCRGLDERRRADGGASEGAKALVTDIASLVVWRSRRVAIAAIAGRDRQRQRA